MLFKNRHQNTKNIKSHKILLGVALSGILSSCSYQTIETPAPGINIIKAGEKFRINLPESHSEGKNWRLKEERKHSINYIAAVWHGEEKGIDFNFQAIQAGQDTLRFTYMKYRDTLDQKVFIVKVD